MSLADRRGFPIAIGALSLAATADQDDTQEKEELKLPGPALIDRAR
jgi:hypothetical protein